VGFAALTTFLSSSVSLSELEELKSSSTTLLTFWGVKMKGSMVHLTVSPLVPSWTGSQGGKISLLTDCQVAL
jgi:hypothetical protein